MLKKGEKLKRIASNIIVVLLFLSLFAFTSNIQPAKASGTIYIRADGSIDPPTANITTSDNATYTFTDNNYDSIVVERDNIVIDGGVYAVRGPEAEVYASRGIDVSERENVTIRKTQVRAFYFGIFGEHSSNISVVESGIVDSEYGVCLEYSVNCIIRESNLTANHWRSISLYSSSNDIIQESNVTGNSVGIEFLDSSNNSIVGNNIIDNYYGVYLSNSLTNGISRNNITTNDECGIGLYSSSNNSISGNDITKNNRYGVYLSGSLGNIICRNNITTNSLCGIYLDYSSNNKIFHNNFVNNNIQVYSSGSTNVWDNGVEGNYWSDYAGVDVNPYDGIGDSPYVIDGNNQDNYPLMSPYLPGDYNHDGTVNMTDVDLVRNAWQSKIGDLNYNPHVDFNMDGIINIKDAAIIGGNWQRHA